MSITTQLRALAHPILKHLSFSISIGTGNQKTQVPIIQGSGLGVYYQLKKCEEEWKLGLFRELLTTRNGHFIDVGANLGQTLIQLRQIDQDRAYVGFEPNPECLNFINRLIHLNEYRNCDLLACGLGEQTGILSLFLPRGRATDSTATLLKDLRPGRSFDEQHVPIFNEEHLQSFLVDRVFGVVKIDVEGAELEVMKGFKNKFKHDRPPILCEVLFTDPKGSLDESRIRNDQMVELLNEIGYQIWQIHKSPDGRGVQQLYKIDSFENAFYTYENASLCDYLFLPEEKAEATLLEIGCQNNV